MNVTCVKFKRYKDTHKCSKRCMKNLQDTWTQHVWVTLANTCQAKTSTENASVFVKKTIAYQQKIYVFESVLIP
jgi:hypothetical protein